MKGNVLDFSFSGLKTAMLRWVQSRDMTNEIAARGELLRSNPHPLLEDWLKVTPKDTLDAIAAFQQIVVEELLRRIERAAEETGARSAIIAGGVACNAGLRREAHSGRLPCPAYFPTPGLSTDNAAMIAAAALPRLARRDFDDLTLRAEANLTLA